MYFHLSPSYQVAIISSQFNDAAMLIVSLSTSRTAVQYFSDIDEQQLLFITTG